MGENPGRNESMAKLLMKIWEGKRENCDLPNDKHELFFKQRRVYFTANICKFQLPRREVMSHLSRSLVCI